MTEARPRTIVHLGEKLLPKHLETIYLTVQPARVDGGAKFDCHDMGCLSSYRGCLMHCDGHRLSTKTIYKVDRMVSS